MRAIGAVAGVFAFIAFTILAFAGVVWAIVLVQAGLDAL